MDRASKTTGQNEFTRQGNHRLSPYAWQAFTVARAFVFVFNFRHAAGVAGLALACASATALAAPRLSCEILQGGSTQTLQFDPVSDPYPVKAVNINDRFRFKAVMVGQAGQVAYIKLYAYAWSSGKAVLLHQVRYLTPVPQAQAGPHALTGLHAVYSPELGREMQYGCALLEVTP